MTISMIRADENMSQNKERRQEGRKHQKLPTGELPRFRCDECQSDGSNA
jgi:hypothetical protein